MKPLAAWSLAATLFLPAANAQTTNFLVDNNGPNCSDVTGNPFCTITAALNAAVPHSTINVAAGTYIEHVFITKEGITIAGCPDAAGVTTIQGVGTGAVTIWQVDYVTVRNLTINGSPSDSQVTGVRAFNASHSHVLDNTIAGRHGVYLDSCVDTDVSGNVFVRRAMHPRGIVLVTGPTGSGKSTTLAAMVDYINDNKPDHILTIEDPIEFVHESKKSLVNQREVHRDTLGFNEALRSALREDPDVILIGELRDLETIRLALTAAETGHLVFGTLHTSSAAKTIDRIVDVFPAAEKEMVRAMLSESLRSVISQTLLKKIGGGRIAAHEIMVGTPAIRNLIREGKIAQMYSAIQTGQGSGMYTLDQNLAELMAKGLINKEEARFRAVNKENF